MTKLIELQHFTDFWYSGKHPSLSRKAEIHQKRLEQQNRQAVLLAAELAHKSPQKLHKRPQKRKKKPGFRPWRLKRSMR